MVEGWGGGGAQKKLHAQSCKANDRVNYYYTRIQYLPCLLFLIASSCMN